MCNRIFSAYDKVFEKPASDEDVEHPILVPIPFFTVNRNLTGRAFV